MTTVIYNLVGYSGQLFRADPTEGVARNGATHYAGDALHFFTTQKSEVASYTRKGTTYTKTWETTRPLILLDIMDLGTRLFLETRISKGNLDASFPIKNGKVYRNSETETAKIDGQIVFDICMLKDELGADGYYMARQEGGNGFLNFHSEIGLCNHAFGKLTLVGAANVKVEAKNAQNASFRKTRSVFGPRNGNGPRNNIGTRRNGNGNGNRKTLKRSLFNSPSPNVKRGLFNSPGPLTMGNLNATNIAPKALAF
jgi:hypothetical protein